MTEAYDSGVIMIANDLAKNIADGDANYLGLLAEADAYIDLHFLDLPPEETPNNRPDPDCVKIPHSPTRLGEAGYQHHYLGNRYVRISHG